MNIIEQHRRIPRWSLTAIVVIAILLLTLLPGDDLPEMPSFPFADKVGHLMMFGGLAATLLYDLSRPLRRVTWKNFLLAAAVSSLFGGCIELLQASINTGRSPEIADFAADVAGAIVCGLIAWPVVNYIVKR